MFEREIETVTSEYANDFRPHYVTALRKNPFLLLIFIVATRQTVFVKRGWLIAFNLNSFLQEKIKMIFH